MEPNILRVTPLPEYKLLLEYATGEVKRFDVLPYITGSWFGELKNPSYFKTVRVLDGLDGIEWPHGQDLAPHELYDDSILVQ